MNRLWVALTFCFMVLAIAIPAIATRIRYGGEKNDGSCDIVGNQDMYGIGIRVGIYLQIFITAMVDAFGTPEHAASIAPANLWFLVAMFVAISTYAWNEGLPAVEGYLLISLGDGITLTVLGGVTKLNPEELEESCLYSFSRYLVWGLWKIYNATYWWKDPSVTKCGATGWLFTSVSLLGWFRVFHKILNLIEIIFWLFAVAPYPFALMWLVYALIRLDTSDWGNKKVSKWTMFCDSWFVSTGEMHKIAYGSQKAQGSLLEGERKPSDLELVRKRFECHLRETYHLPPCEDPPTGPSFAGVWWYRTHLIDLLEHLGLGDFPFLVLWDVGVLVLTVCTVELSITLNNVKGVNFMGTAGQTIAFVVGLGGILTALGEYYVRKRRLGQYNIADHPDWNLLEQRARRRTAP